MDQEIKTILDAHSAKIEAIYVSVEKTRKYFLVTMWVTLLAIILPLLGLFFILPSFLSSYIGGLTQY